MYNIQSIVMESEWIVLRIAPVDERETGKSLASSTAAQRGKLVFLCTPKTDSQGKIREVVLCGGGHFHSLSTKPCEIKSKAVVK